MVLMLSSLRAGDTNQPIPTSNFRTHTLYIREQPLHYGGGAWKTFGKYNLALLLDEKNNLAQPVR